MTVPIEASYAPDTKRVQKHKGADKQVPHLWVVYQCPDAKHGGASKLDAYQGPPYCREHNCYLIPINLGVEHVNHNRAKVDASASAKGRPHQ